MDFSAKGKTNGQSGERARDWRFNPSLWTFKGHPTIKKKIATYSLSTLLAIQSVFMPVLPAFAQQKPKSESIINSTEPAPENSSDSVSETFKNKEVQTSFRGNEGMIMTTRMVEKPQEKQPIIVTPMKVKAFEAFIEKWGKDHKNELDVYNDIKSNSKSYYLSENNSKLAGAKKIDFSYDLCTRTLSNIKAVESTNPAINENPIYKECVELTDAQIARLQARHSERVAAGVYNVESTLVRDNAVLSGLILRFGVASLVAAGSKDPSKLDKAREMLESVKKGESINLYSYLGDFIFDSYYIHNSESNKTLEGEYHRCMTQLLTPLQIKSINWAACSYSTDEKGCIAIKPDFQDLSPDGTQFTAENMRAVYLTKYTTEGLSNLKKSLNAGGIVNIPAGAELPYNSRIQARDYNSKFFDWDPQKKKWVRNIRGEKYAIVQDLSGERTGVNILAYGNSPEALPIIFQLNRYIERKVFPAANVGVTDSDAMDILINVPRTFDVTEYSMKSSKDRTERELANLQKAIKDKNIDNLPLPANVKNELKSKKIEIQPLSASQYSELYSQIFGHLLLNHALSVGERILPLRDPNFLFPQITHELSSDDRKARGKGVEVGMTHPTVEEIINLGTIYIPVIVGSNELKGEVKVGVPKNEKGVLLDYDAQGNLLGGRLVGAHDNQGNLIAKGNLSWNQRPTVDEWGMKLVGNSLQNSPPRTYVPDLPAQVIDARLTLDGNPTNNNLVLMEDAVKAVEKSKGKKFSEMLNMNDPKVKASGLTKDEVSLILKREVPQGAVGKISKVFDQVSMDTLFKNVQTSITKEGGYSLSFTWMDNAGNTKMSSANITILPTAAGYIDVEFIPDKDGNIAKYNAANGFFSATVDVKAYSTLLGGAETNVNLPVDIKGNPEFYLKAHLRKESQLFSSAKIEEIKGRGGVITKDVYDKAVKHDLCNPQEFRDLGAAIGLSSKEMKLLFKAKDPAGNPIFTPAEKETIKKNLNLTNTQLQMAIRFANLSPETIERLKNIKPLDENQISFLEYSAYRRMLRPEEIEDKEIVPHKDEKGNVVPGRYDIRMPLLPTEDTQAYSLQIYAVDRAYEDKKGSTAASRIKTKKDIFETRYSATADALATPTDHLFILEPSSDKSAAHARSMTGFYLNSSMTDMEENNWGLSKANMNNLNNTTTALKNFASLNGNALLQYEQDNGGFQSAYESTITGLFQDLDNAKAGVINGIKLSAVNAMLADYSGDSYLLVLQRYLDPSTLASQKPSVDEAMDALIHSPLGSKLGGLSELISTPEISVKTDMTPIVATVRVPWPTQFFLTDKRLDEIAENKEVTWSEFLYIMRGGNQALSEKMLGHLPGVREGKLSPKMLFGLISKGEGLKDFNKIYDSNKLSDAELDALDKIGFFKEMAGATEAKERRILDLGDYVKYKQLMASEENKSKVPAGVQNSLERFGKTVKVTDNVANELKRNENFKRGVYKTFKAVILGRVDATTTFTINGQQQEPLKWDTQKFGLELDVGYGNLAIVGGSAWSLSYSPKNVRPLFPIRDAAANLASGFDIWGKVKKKRSIWEEVTYHSGKAIVHTLKTVSAETDYSISKVSGGKVAMSMSIPLASTWWYLGKKWPMHLAVSEEYSNFLGTYADGKFQGSSYFDAKTGNFTPVYMAYLNTTFGKFSLKFHGDVDNPTLTYSDPWGMFDIGYSERVLVKGEEKGKSISLNINQGFWNLLAKLFKISDDPGYHLHKKTDNK
jgi:hypothetical protein